MAIIAYAYDNGRLPSDVWREFQDHHQEDFRLLFALASWRMEQEKEAAKKQNKPPHTGFGGRALGG